MTEKEELETLKELISDLMGFIQENTRTITVVLERLYALEAKDID